VRGRDAWRLAGPAGALASTREALISHLRRKALVWGRNLREGPRPLPSSPLPLPPVGRAPMGSLGLALTGLWVSAAEGATSDSSLALILGTALLVLVLGWVLSAWRAPPRHQGAW